MVLSVCVGSVSTRPSTGPGHLSAFTSSYFPLLSFTREHLASGLLHLFLMLESLFVLAFTADTRTGGFDAMTIWSTGPAEPQDETEASTPPRRNIPPSFSDSSKFEMSFLSSSIFSFLFFNINLFILCVRV